MKKTTLTSFAFLIIGFIAGAYSIIKVFAVKPDFLGAPYLNTPVIANKDVVLTQGSLKITIPKGTTLQYRYEAKDQPFYSLQIVGWPHENRPFKRAKHWDYFYVAHQSKSK